MKDPNAWKKEPRLDFLNKKLKKGNLIVVLNPYYRDLAKAKVVKITPAKITVRLEGSSGTFNGEITSRYSSQVIKYAENESKK